MDVLASIREDAAGINNTHEELRNYFTVVLPQKSDQIRAILNDAEFIKLYQLIGKNVRNSGSPILHEKKQGMFFALAERINQVVKKIRDSKQHGEKTFIVIDAIRNPFEAIYFQDRYAAFYLMAVSCDDGQRKARLRAVGHTDKDIKAIDEQEYPDVKISNKSAYVLQDIAACLERADIYVSNPDIANLVSEFHNLTNQILTFVSLMRRPGLVTPTALERCMQFAYTAKLNSGCISRQVGAVITDENFSIQAVGWNDTPHGQVPCNLRNRFDLEGGIDQLAYSTYEKNDPEFVKKFKERSRKYIRIAEGGRNISYCFKSEYQINTNEKNQVHTRALHAEENAFLQITKYGGRGIEGGKLFTTASPCELCSKKAYQLGIKEIYYIDPYPGIAVHHILMGGTNNPRLMLFSGAIGRAFHRLYTPIVPYKDELATLTVEA
jgi:deoxycytidylate deaminase